MSYKVYNMHRLDTLDKIIHKVNCLILLFTDEDRTHSVIDNLVNKNGLPDKIIALYFDDYDTTKIDNFFSAMDCSINKIKVGSNLSEPLNPCLMAIDSLVKKITILGVDITCMPIPIFAQIFHYLYETKKSTVAYYTQPEHYNLDNLFDFAAYDGEIEIDNVPGYSGKTAQQDEAQRMLLYQIGFEVKYMSIRIEQDVNPDEIIPINGFPSYFPKYKDISLINNNVNYYAKSKEIVYSEANNPFDAYNQLMRLRDKHPKYCIDVFTSGSKPMALGACLFALKSGNNDVRLLFPYPSDYNRKQSSGNGIVWEYVL